MYSTMRDALKGVWVNPDFESFGSNRDYYTSQKAKNVPDYVSVGKCFTRQTDSLLNRNTYTTSSENEAKRFIELLKENKDGFVVGNNYQKTTVVAGDDVQINYQITMLLTSTGVRLANKLMSESSIELVNAGHQKPNEKVLTCLGLNY